MLGIDPYTGLHVDPLPITDMSWAKAAQRLKELEAAYQAVAQPNGFCTLKTGRSNPDGTPEHVTVTYADRPQLRRAILTLQPRPILYS